MEKKYIQEGEVRPFDIYVGVPDGSDVSNVNAYAYDITDGTKTLINGFVDAGALTNGVRIVCSGATYGHTYRVLIEAALDTGETRAKVLLVECRKASEKVRPIRPSTREMYLLDFTSDVPSGIDMDAASSSGTAYEFGDLSTDIYATVGQSITADGTNSYRLRLDVDNLTAWQDVIVSVLGYTETDTVTNTVYRIRKTIHIPCVED